MGHHFMIFLSRKIPFFKTMAFLIIFFYSFAGDFYSGSPRVAFLDFESKVQVDFTTVTAKVAAKQMDKLAKSALNTYINNMVYDILNNALDNRTTGVVEKEEVEMIEEKDMYLQLSSQVLKLHSRNHGFF